MEAIRCTECDDVRWSLLGIGKRDLGKCELCGGQMVRERRHPARGNGRLAIERRDMNQTAASPPSARPSL